MRIRIESENRLQTAEEYRTMEGLSLLDVAIIRHSVDLFYSYGSNRLPYRGGRLRTHAERGEILPARLLSALTTLVRRGYLVSVCSGDSDGECYFMSERGRDFLRNYDLNEER